MIIIKKELKKSPFISIIIPIYNAEKYLNDCIDSILSQTFSNFELILINDGSTDNSLEIISSYNDDRLKIISRKNKGAAYSRFEGIKKAIGKYILFVDSDDLLEKETLEKYIREIESNQYDYIRGNYKQLINNKQIKRINDFKKTFDFTSENIEKNIILPMALSDKYNSLWRELIKKDIIDISKIDQSIFMGDDMLFNYYMYKNIKSGKIITEYLYLYRINIESITNVKKTDKLIKNMDDVLKANRYIIEDVELTYSNETIKSWYKRYIKQINHSLYKIYRTGEYELAKKETNRIFNDSKLKEVRKIIKPKDMLFSLEYLFYRLILNSNVDKYYKFMKKFSKIYKK